MTAMEGGGSGAPGAAAAAAVATPTPGGGALIEIPLEVDSGAAAGADVEGTTSDNGLPPRGRGVSRAVADILTVSGKPVRATLAGCKLAGCVLKFSTLALLASAALLFWGSSLTHSDLLLGLLVAIGLLCIFGSCLSCYGAVQLAWYRALVQRANDTLDRGSDAATRIGSGESAATVARGLVTPEAVAGRLGGRVLRTLGLSGKNAERALAAAKEVQRMRSASGQGGVEAVAGGGDDSKV